MKRLFSLVLFFAFCGLYAQDTYPTNGVKDVRSKHYAFTNATVYTNYNKKIENATLVIKDGKVVSVTTGGNVPKGAVELDCSGKIIYPSFIELVSGYGLAEPSKDRRKWTDPPQFISNKKGAYGWNEAIKPEINAFETYEADKKKAEGMRKMGFGAVLSHHQDGIARGTACLVDLSDEKASESLIKDKVSAHYSFKKGSSKQDYPSSLMGAIALMQQTYHDADWYANQTGVAETNFSLQAWNEIQSLPQIFHAGDKLDILRADKLGDEFGKQYIIEGKGDSYQRADAIKATNAKLIVPLNFPAAYDVSDPYEAMYVELNDMMHWELAPYNPRFLKEAGVDFVFTTNQLKDKKAFWGNVKKAIKCGLSKEDALKALTENAASFINASDVLGSLQSGKIANFLICNDDIFEKGEILENWVAGNQFVFKQPNQNDLTGQYDLTLSTDRRAYTLEITGKPEKHKGEIVINDSTRIDVGFKLKDDQLSMAFKLKEEENHIRLSGMLGKDMWKGNGKNQQGEWVEWAVRNKRDIPEKEDKEKGEKKEKVEEAPKEKTAEKDKEDKGEDALTEICYPFLPYGWTDKPEQKSVLFKNATVWTNEKDGILENTDVLISNGKISKIGKGLPEGSATVVDATGKHLTCGIVDEHSHIAISRGVNEGTQASSAEVSIGNSVNSEDINIYRQLAGGVTSAQLLHGSANPIGGQSAIIKFRWGATPEEMKFEGADGFIKFALGENVKQSNWGDNNTVRFPQTRMGVEQVYIDHFTRAKEYEAAKKAGGNVRTDIELETLLEIINKERFITCHSYVQSEITMLMRVAERFGFNINTFTHILEGYKIADKMKVHGVNASSFSDWWTYKYEVIDAIPYNGAILHEMGVNTAFNSDDAEMARRLNTEAAKAVKYGGVSEEDAWKFVTLNPAKALHIDNRVGSIKVGKDADLVLWDNHPMSIYTKAEQTYVDGRCYFNINNDEAMRKTIEQERNRLIQKMLEEKANGGKTQKPSMHRQHLWHCDDIDDYCTEHQGGHTHEHDDH